MGGRNSKPKQPKEAAEPVDPALGDGILADLDKQLAAIDAGEDAALPASLETPALGDIEKFGEGADGDVTIHDDEIAELEEELAGLDLDGATPETVAVAADTTAAGESAADAVAAVQSSVVDSKVVHAVTEAADMPEQEAALVRPLAG